MSEEFISPDIHHEHVSHEGTEKAHEGLNTKVIWKVFWILLGVTIFEVSISFTAIPKTILLYTFIALTIVKAYYIVGYFMHSDVPVAGKLVSPDTLLNKIWAATNASYLSNLMGYPTDCPQREKNGWTGDARSCLAVLERKFS